MPPKKPSVAAWVLGWLPRRTAAASPMPLTERKPLAACEELTQPRHVLLTACSAASGRPEFPLRQRKPCLKPCPLTPSAASPATTGHHQYKAVDVYSGWQREIREECLRLNRLDQRQWGKPAPSMPGWENGLGLPRQQQGWESEETDVASDSYGKVSSLTRTGTCPTCTPPPCLSAHRLATDPRTRSTCPRTGREHPATAQSQRRLPVPTVRRPIPSLLLTPPTSPPRPRLGMQEPRPTSPCPRSRKKAEAPTRTTWNLPRTYQTSTSISQNPDAAVCSASVPGILSPRPPASASPPAGFRIYPQAPNPTSQLKELLNLMTQTVSQHRRYTGVLYGFARPSAPGMLKIGVVKDRVVARWPFADPVDHRLATWQAQCGHSVIEVFRKPIACNAAERIERLVHQALREYRRVEDPPCRPCERRKTASKARTGGGRCSGGQHNEWFEVDVETALHAVDLWAIFAERQPYDRFGKLLDFWSTRVEAGIRPGDTVKSWQEKVPWVALLDRLPPTEVEDLISHFCRQGI